VFGTTNDANFDVVGKMGLPLVSRLPEEYGPPSISVSGADGGYNMYNLQRQIGRAFARIQCSFDGQLELAEGASFPEVRRRRRTPWSDIRSGSRAARSVQFQRTYTGASVADFMLGYISSDNINPTHTNTDLANTWTAFYVNDDYKVTSRLTLTLGLRYDYFQRYKQSDDKFANVEPERFRDRQHCDARDLAIRRELMRPIATILDRGSDSHGVHRSRARPSSERVRHLLHSRDFQCDFRYGGRRASDCWGDHHRKHRWCSKRVL